MEYVQHHLHNKNIGHRNTATTVVGTTEISFVAYAILWNKARANPICSGIPYSDSVVEDVYTYLLQALVEAIGDI